MYKTIFVKPGNKGWGVGLTLTPTEKMNKVVSVTGGGIHPVAQQHAMGLKIKFQRMKRFAPLSIAAEQHGSVCIQ